MKKLVFFPTRFFKSFKKNFSFDHLWSLKPEQIITEHKTSDVARIVLRDDDAAQDINGYRKRYWYLGVRGSLKGTFRNTFFGRSRAHAEYRNLSHLFTLGLSAVSPLVYGEDRSFRLLRRAIIITESLPDTDTLTDFLLSKQYQEAEPDLRRRFICSLGRWISQMHNRGYKDRDLFARNILVHRFKQGWRFSKIDSSAATGRRLMPCSGSPYKKDLQDLNMDLCRNLSRTDRLRCLLAYTAAGNVDQGVRSLVRAIL